ncbi:MAG: phosphate ABC transporter permease PstA [Opitutales bacterium]|nr:phosphate ABC transporter permease PstA [Opitutales bacterium]
MENNASNKTRKSLAPKGEVWVWFTSLGLVLGLAMVLFLFGLILLRGFNFFWPVPVVQLELKEDSEAVFRGNTSFAGVIASTQERSLQEIAVEEEILLEEEEEVEADGILGQALQTISEYRVFVGSRDRYGQSFRYFRHNDILERSFPEDIIRAERRVEGDAFFFPQRIQFQDGSEVTREDANFEDELDRVVKEGRARRSQINRIDRREIGPINLEIRELTMDLRFLNRIERTEGDLSEAQEAQRERLTERIAQLNEQFELLRDKADELRETNQSIRVFYEYADGTSGQIAIGDLFRFYYPNRLGFFQRIQVAGIQFWEFVSGYPREANMSGGIFPAIFGTFVMTLIMSIAVTPFGVITAIYLREYAVQGPLVRAVRIAINNLAGVPSIVFGVFGLGFFVYIMGGTIDSLFFSQAQELGTPTFGTGGILWAGLTLALLNLPVVIVATEESISAVPRGVREGSLACGASKWQTIQRLVIPASLPGILTGMILAMARGAGEVAPLMLVGVVALAPNLPVDGTFPFVHLERKFMHLGFHIYDVGFQSPDSEAAIPTVFATTLILIALIVVLNLSAILLRNHIRKKHKGSAF